jgi:SUN domain-containing protein 1/2
LAVALAAPTYISDITIDHVAKEVAFDMRSAPREMEVWAMVEGKDNVAKVKAWHAEKALRKKEAKMAAKERGLSFDDEADVVYPKTLPKAPQYIRIANFTYNIHAPRNIQTFPVDEEIRELGVDFGIVVLRIKSNWGRDEYTCLYRLRVHGERMGETPLPYPEESV